jgi:cytoskeletal protein RodZ
MSTVAEQLRQAREAQHLTVQQVVQITKIRTDHLVALEEGNFNVFSAPVYIRGFVRTYSGLLKLDVPQVMACLDTELSATQKFAEPPPLAEPAHGALDFIMLQFSKLDWRKAAVGLLVLAVLALCFSSVASWRRSKAANPLNGLKPGIYQSTQNMSGETLPLPAPAPKPSH